MTERSNHPSSPIDWEAFYGNYRKPGYVPGFEILHKIGGGAFGMVFKARKESIAKDYAIKFLKVDDEGVRDAIVSELKAVRFFAQVDHPNLVSIEDKGEVDGIPYIVMNHAGDATLRSRLDEGPLGREEALRIFLQVARGVQALHEHSLVHFDLKPANVFLKNDFARVGDYGLSRLVSQSRNSLSFGRGTPYYMAPEMLRRKGDHRSDIYSLGVLLFECLTGAVPFKGDSEWEVLRKHETEAPVYPPALGEPERSVLARCLEKRPADRFSTTSEVIAALSSPGYATDARAPTSRPIPVPPPPPRRPPPPPRADSAAPHPPRRRQRSRAWGPLSALFVVSLVLAPLLFLTKAHRQQARTQATADRHAIARTAYRTRTSSGAGFAQRPPTPRSVQPQRPFDARTLPALSYPSQTSNSVRRYVEDNVTNLLEEHGASRDTHREYIVKKLRRHKSEALVCSVNKLRNLDHRDPYENRQAYELNQLLSKLTGKSYRIVVANPSCALQPDQIDYNGRTVQKWWKYWQSKYACQ